ncbi:unnamed protein product, partial [Musa textilis]
QWALRRKCAEGRLQLPHLPPRERMREEDGSGISVVLLPTLCLRRSTCSELRREIFFVVVY